MCFVADFAQNMNIPNFASEQPGATYYYAPMSVYVFGVVDASQDRLAAYVYIEDQANKGGNNVASLLMLHLQRSGIFDQASSDGPFKELNIVMDNCGGQNKNRHVLRLLHFLVKRKVSTIAQAIFLVRGHTKNNCNRLFNTMKKEYRKTNCFTPQDLLNGMRHEKVDPLMVPADAFRDWDKLEEPYIKPPTGVTKANHIFTVDINKNNGNTMQLQVSDTAPETELLLVKRQYHDNGAQFWQDLQPDVIPPVGIQDIKWNEMFKKWAPFVPVDKRKELRYYHEEPPEEIQKKVKAQSKQARAVRKERARTVHKGDGKKPPAKKATKVKPTAKNQAATGGQQQSGTI
jgi:hypothetical protein